MINIYLHPEVKSLIEQLGISNPNEYTENLIKSKENKASKGFKRDDVVATLISDSFPVNFKGNTNNGGNKASHKKFNPTVAGYVIANVAPDLSKDIFKGIFFENKSSVNEHIKTFYELDNPEYQELPQTKIKLNTKAYKKHFRILAENNVAAAKAHGATKIVFPGMGLGIYSGPLNGKVNDLQILADLQIEVLKGIAEQNADLEFKFFGLGSKSSNIGKQSNLEGIAFNAKQAMIEENDSSKILRVVAGSINIPLGGGSGDNRQITTDTNAAEVRRDATIYRIIDPCNLTANLNIPLGGGSNDISAEPINTIQDALSAYINAVVAISNKDINIEDPKNDYQKIKELIRSLKDRDFSRFDKNEKLKDIVTAERNLLRELYNAKERTDPSLWNIIIEFIKDIGSLIVRPFRTERTWVNSLNQTELVEQQL